jgi:hypothetical protein
MVRKTRVYRVATETPAGWYWTCAWCFTTATTPAPSWDKAVDALMDEHTKACAPYQRWFALYAVLERRHGRRRKAAQQARVVLPKGEETLPLFSSETVSHEGEEMDP